ncbi:MAG: hypothetical protein ACYS76_16215 [Planctomycetota bacterium]|jgi:hypothetical protein
MPTTDYNGGQNNDFYIISPVSTPADGTTRKMCIVGRRWNYDFWTDPGGGADYDKNVNWNGSQLGSYTQRIRSQFDYSTGSPQDNTIYPAGPAFKWFADSTQSLVDAQYSSGYRYDKLSVEDCSFATVAAFTIPEWSLTTSASQGLVPGNFSGTHTLRGWTGASDTGTSVGAMVHNTDNSTDGILQNTKRCIMNYMHPGGCRIVDAGASAVYNGLQEFGTGSGIVALPFKVRGRNLRGRTSFPNDNCDVVMLAQWDTDTKLRITSSQTSDTLAYNFVGSNLSGTPSMIVIQDAFRYDPTGDALTIEFEVSSSKAVIIHSMSIYETTGDEV